MAKSYNLKITSATVIAGNVVGAGATVLDVSDLLARRLLSSGKAELADGDDLPEADDTGGEVSPAENPDADGEVEPAQTTEAVKKSGSNAKAKRDEAQ